MSKLNNYDSRNPKKQKKKKRVLEFAKRLLNAKKDIIDFFEKGIFPYRGNVFTTKEKEESEENKFFEYIEDETKSINYDLFEDYFNFAAPTDLAKKLFKIKDKKKNNDFVELIRNRWSNLKDEIKKMSSDEKKN